MGLTQGKGEGKEGGRYGNATTQEFDLERRIEKKRSGGVRPGTTHNDLKEN